MFSDLKNYNLKSHVVQVQHAILFPRGKVIELAYHAQLTKFEISDFVKTSKKTRFTKLILKRKNCSNIL